MTVLHLRQIKATWYDLRLIAKSGVLPVLMRGLIRPLSFSSEATEEVPNDKPNPNFSHLRVEITSESETWRRRWSFGCLRKSSHRCKTHSPLEKPSYSLHKSFLHKSFLSPHFSIQTGWWGNKNEREKWIKRCLLWLNDLRIRTISRQGQTHSSASSRLLD